MKGKSNGKYFKGKFGLGGGIFFYLMPALGYWANWRRATQYRPVIDMSYPIHVMPVHNTISTGSIRRLPEWSDVRALANQHPEVACGGCPIRGYRQAATIVKRCPLLSNACFLLHLLRAGFDGRILDERNDRGRRLVEFAESKSSYASNIFFNRPKFNQWLSWVKMKSITSWSIGKCKFRYL